MSQLGKRYRQALGVIDREHAYSPLEAANLARKIAAITLTI